jgi:uncharacterized membrane protein YjjB (DUF3815 family)
MTLHVFLAFIGSLTSGLTFNIKGRKLIFAGFSGMSGFFVYSFLFRLTGSSVFSIFFGAVAVGLYSEIAARLLKSPSTVFSIPGILPLVPGITAYEMIQYLMNNQLIPAISKMIETSVGAGAIAFGILLVTAVFRIITKIRRERIEKVSRIHTDK